MNNKETRQLLVKLPVKVYEELAQEAARRTTSEGKEVTKQDLLLESLQESLKRIDDGD